MTAYSGLFNGVHNENYALLVDEAPGRKHLSRILRKSKRGMRVTQELLLTTIGAAAGSAALAQHRRVKAVATPGGTNSQGGVRTIETVDLINRNSAAADVTALKAIVDRATKPSTYPTDASGNGGGGKLGF